MIEPERCGGSWGDPVRDILSLRLLSLDTSATAVDALRMLNFHRASSLVVLDDGLPAGIFTERDVTRQAEHIMSQPDLPITTVMTTPVISASDDIDLRQAYGMLVSHKIRHLVLTDAHGRALGTVTEDDIIQRLGIEYFVDIKSAAEILNPAVGQYPPDTPLGHILHEMSERNITCVIAAEQRRPLGIFTERDLVNLCQGRDKPGRLLLRDVMTTPVRTVPLSTNAHECIVHMQKERIRRLVVIDDEALVAGLVTQSDVLAALEGRYTEYLKDTLAQREHELRSARLALNRQAVLDRILKSSVDTGILAMDADYTVRYANTAARQMLPVIKFMLKSRLSGDAELRSAIASGRSVGLCLHAGDADDTRHFGVNVCAILDGETTLEGYLLTVNEITRRIRNEEQLKWTIDTYQALFDDQPALYLILDEQAGIKSVNRYGADQLGYARETLLSHYFDELLYETRPEIIQDVLSQIRSDEITALEVRLRHGTAEPVWYRFNKRHMKQHDQDPVILLVGTDITEARRYSERLSYEASHDPLTGLLNRRAFSQRLASLLDNVKRVRGEHALCYLDLDEFKHINDQLGHAIGDRVLREVADCLAGCIRKRDTLCRLGGDEFGLLIEDCSAHQAQRVIADLQRIIRDYRLLLDGREYTVGISIGVVPIHASSQDQQMILQMADEACYRAKRQGRDRVYFAD